MTIEKLVTHDEAPAALQEPSLIITTPSRATTSFTGGLFALALFTTLYFAYEIVIPVLLAFILKLFLQPVIRIFEKFKIPRSLAAIFVIFILLGSFVGLGTILYRPTVVWAEKLPAGIPQLQQRLTFLSKPIETMQKFLIRAERVTEGTHTKTIPVAIEGNRLSDKLLHGTRALVGGVLTTLLILFFLISSGDTFLRRLVEILPRFENKRQAVAISQQIERDIAGYLLTITLVNAGIGLIMGSIMFTLGIGDPILWGTLTFLLNYIPIIGPLIGIFIFLLAGLLDYSLLSYAVLPATIYVLVHFLESSILTPHLLAKRFTLNPVLVIFSLIFWFWMWGVPGAILAMPILAITKIICDRVDRLSAFGHFMEA